MMKQASLFCGVLFAASSVWAQISTISTQRSVAVSGSAAASAQTSTYSVVNTSIEATPVFSSTVSSNAAAYSVGTGAYGLDVSAYASSSASQVSSITSTGISIRCNLQAQTWSDLPTWPGVCSGSAESLFETTFTVSTPGLFQVDYSGSFFGQDYPGLNFSAQLFSQSGMVFDLSRSSLGRDSFTIGLMTGQDYTLRMEASATAANPDPLGELGVVDAQLSLNRVVTVVPEPGAGAILTLSAGLWLLRRNVTRRSK